MNVTASSPSRLLKITAVTARWLLGLLVAAWLLFALVVVVLHGWIVPRIGEYRGVLEAQATRSIGVPVTIGAITAKSEGLLGSFFPTFELRDVVLHDAQNRDALRLGRVVAGFSPRSMWRLSFERLFIERPEVEVRLDALGKIHIAGLDMSTETSGESRGADWIFSQREVVVEGGTVRWTDERRAAPPLLLTEVHFTARNRGRTHELALEATPPQGWGERLAIRGEFRQPLLSVRSGNWHEWDGQIYADLPHVDVSRIGSYVSLDVVVRQGSGALRAWGDVRKGRLVSGVVDLGLDAIDVSINEKLEPLALRAVTGRLAASKIDNTLEFSTTNLQFNTSDGVRWPGGNLWFKHTLPTGRAVERGAFRADKLDLAMLAQIANRLPLGDTLHRELGARAPRGLVEKIEMSWDGAMESPTHYDARGKVSGMSLASEPGDHAGAVGKPGVSGATVEFEASQDGGNATLAIAKGALDLPGVFENPVVPIDELSTRAQWKFDGDKTQVQLSNLRFANPDAQGEAKMTWRTSDAATSPSRDRFPGVLDLEGKLTRADGTRVFRYLPLHIPQHTRDYVHEAITKGVASSVDFRVKGDLFDMPFMDPRQGTFRIVAKVSDVTYAYVPHVSGANGGSGAAQPTWPALTGASAELIFERAGMQVRNARARLAGAQGIEITKGEAEIADMSHRTPLLKVDAQASGPLAEVLRAGAPLAGQASDIAAHARATGNADYRLRLDLPLETPDKAKVQASITLNDNELQIAPDIPAFTQAKGVLNFTESGFSLTALRARLAGGDMRIDGKGRYAGTSHDLGFHAQGIVSAEGLRAVREVGWLSRLARKMNGSTAYTADFSLRDGVSEFLVTSSLQGLALQLPAPLIKPAEDVMALRLEKKIVLREKASTQERVQDRLSFDLGRMASATWLRDISGPQERIVNGGIGVGLATGETVVSPERGVLANINLARFDVGAWKAAFSETTGVATNVPAGTASDDASPYLPSAIAVRAQELRFAGRRLNNVVLGGSREGTVWRANVDSDELSGYIEYGQAQAGRLHARLARLKIARGEASEVESLLDEQSASLPALDIVVDDFELLGKRLGRAEIEAVNRGGPTREWRLNRLNLTVPEGSFTALGAWATPNGIAGEPRRTSLTFKLDISDAGGLLNRFGMKDVVRRGRGRLEGDVGWRGSPFSIDYPSMDGKLHIDVETGQFLKADPGLAKLLGVLSLQALPRRLTLDFRDVFSEGFAFDFIRGDANIAKGVASTNNLQMKGVNAAALMDGSADFARETQNLRVVVVPEINAGTASLVATAINPAIGLATFLAQMALRKPLSAAATQEFQIDGTWTDPKITKMPRRPALDVPVPSARQEAQTETKP
ncbi:YhdP family protein [Variovorax sp. J22R133]|uniref:YhdP family protein n=1 Tax=Variovorax brevis TaxID=3053503 RepID=UPI002578B84B|nr:YhdP family protein [Variovorax sp. J22R133]MDM0115298.1 YhdP family protein [Variovorax sp. J22R133]